MLNWIAEEREKVAEAKREHLKGYSKLELLLLDKKIQKELDLIDTNTRLRYRQTKLNAYYKEVEKERKRVNELIDNINIKLNDYLDDIKCLTKDVKPVHIEAKWGNPVLYPEEEIEDNTEIVYIVCDPLKLSFLQEKIK